MTLGCYFAFGKNQFGFGLKANNILYLNESNPIGRMIFVYKYLD